MRASTCFGSAVLILLSATVAQDIQRHAPHLLPAEVAALGFDPTAGRLAALMQSPVHWPGLEMYHRIGARWHAGTDSVPAIRRLVADVPRRRLLGLQLAHQTLTTWEWDGSAWSQRGTLQLNQPPNELLACFHEGLGRVVLIDPLLRTLAWDGSQWQQIGGAPTTSSWGNGALVYDRARDRCVYYNGFELFEWDGATWQQRTLAVWPPARTEFGFVHDPLRQRSVLFGGVASTQLQDTWEYDGTQWTQLAPAHQPAARMRMAIAYDPLRQRTVMLGGSSHGSPQGSFRNWHNDEWEWDGQDWHGVQVDRRPPFVDHVGLAEDPVGGGVLLTTNRWSPTGTTMWRWNGADWFPHAPGSVTPGNVDAVCSDPFRGAIWCFDGGLPARTWRFDGVAWQLQTPALSPSPRSGAAIAYDRSRNVVVLFGGDDYFTTFDDTWEWNGTDWNERSPTTRPLPRFNHTMAFDRISGRVLMTGGNSGGSHSIWAFDGNDWQDLGQPVAAGFSLRMVEHRGRVVLWNGTGWTAEWDGNGWTPWLTMPARLAAARYVQGTAAGDALLLFDHANTWIVSPHRAQAVAYGSGCGAAGVPRLDASGVPTPGTTGFGLAIDQVEPSAFAFLLASLVPDSVPFGACTLLLQAPVTIGGAPTNGAGLVVFDVAIPAAAWLLGLDVHWQAITFGTGGVASTPGLRTTIGY